ncbi:MAG TPA: hypothetical protein VFB70_13770, partial [Pyrinomonadaceae bacterium]|nr:hypothetical protein [Pyrinomonadaceae bacterium]
MIRTKTLTSYLTTTGLGFLAGALGHVCWRLGLLPNLSTGSTPDVPVAGAVLVGYSVALSIVVNRLGLRNCWRYLAGSVVVLATGWIVGSQFFGVDLLLLPLL